MRDKQASEPQTQATDSVQDSVQESVQGSAPIPAPIPAPGGVAEASPTAQSPATAFKPRAEGSSTTVKVALEILGSEQTFVCRAGEEERLRAHAGALERRLTALGGTSENTDKGRFLIAAALQLADELYEGKREHEAELRTLQEAHLREVEQLHTAHEKSQQATAESNQAEREKRQGQEEALRQRLEHLLGLLSNESKSQT